MSPATDVLKKWAKQLKKKVAENDPIATLRVGRILHNYRGGTISHSTALFIIARELGFASWPKLLRASDQELRGKISEGEK